MRRRLVKKKAKIVADKLGDRLIERHPKAMDGLLYTWGDSTIEKAGEFLVWSRLNTPNKW